MTKISWIKINTDLFDNRKIRHIRKLPNGNSIVLIWIMLLTTAGKCNADGEIFLTRDIPYTPKMLADEFDLDEDMIRLAIDVLCKYGMLLSDGDTLSIKGWSDHQNVDGMNKVREQNRLRQQKHRSEKKADTTERDMSRDTERDMSRDTSSDVTLRHATDIDIDIDIEKESKKKSSQPVRHKYGEYKNVLLSDSDLEKLKAEFPSDWKDRIERLSSYMASHGKSYKNHLATIRNWAERDKSRGQPVQMSGKESCMGVTFEL